MAQSLCICSASLLIDCRLTSAWPYVLRSSTIIQSQCAGVNAPMVRLLPPQSFSGVRVPHSSLTAHAGSGIELSLRQKKKNPHQPSLRTHTNPHKHAHIPIHTNTHRDTHMAMVAAPFWHLCWWLVLVAVVSNETRTNSFFKSSYQQLRGFRIRAVQWGGWSTCTTERQDVKISLTRTMRSNLNSPPKEPEKVRLRIGGVAT